MKSELILTPVLRNWKTEKYLEKDDKFITVFGSFFPIKNFQRSENLENDETFYLYSN